MTEREEKGAGDIASAARCKRFKASTPQGMQKLFVLLSRFCETGGGVLKPSGYRSCTAGIILKIDVKNFRNYFFKKLKRN